MNRRCQFLNIPIPMCLFVLMYNREMCISMHGRIFVGRDWLIMRIASIVSWCIRYLYCLLRSVCCFCCWFCGMRHGLGDGYMEVI